MAFQAVDAPMLLGARSFYRCYVLPPGLVRNSLHNLLNHHSIAMGLRSYFKPKKAPASIEGTPAGNADPPANSSAASAIDYSINASKVSLYNDEVQRDIIINFLFQKQCTGMWIQDVAGTSEGVILKQANNNFLTMPFTLHGSPLHNAIISLNAKVRESPPLLMVRQVLMINRLL